MLSDSQDNVALLRLRPCRCPLPALIVFLFIIACIFTISQATSIAVQVDPEAGDDSRCAATFKCRSIAYAVQVIGVSQVNLSSGVYNESTITISNAAALVIRGVSSSTLFDCSRRLGLTWGAAFIISNSTVTFIDISFLHCSDTNINGGAVSAFGSSVTVLHCYFFNCSAASGGAVSATGTGSSVFLNVHNSTFMRNAAVGGVTGCPDSHRSGEPCSVWGGAIATFEMPNVSVTGCSMTTNSALAAVPSQSPQNAASRNAVAGGGCVSVLFRGNSSASAVYFSGNSFSHCTVDVSTSRNILVGNGTFHSIISTASSRSHPTDAQDSVARCRCTLVWLPVHSSSMSRRSAMSSATTCSQTVL
jgi:hypothetical protein